MRAMAAKGIIPGLKPGQWNDVEFRGSEARAGWDRGGPSLDGNVLNNLLILFEGPQDARVLLYGTVRVQTKLLRCLSRTAFQCKNI